MFIRCIMVKVPKCLCLSFLVSFCVFNCVCEYIADQVLSMVAMAFHPTPFSPQWSGDPSTIVSEFSSSRWILMPLCFFFF